MICIEVPYQKLACQLHAIPDILKTIGFAAFFRPQIRKSSEKAKIAGELRETIDFVIRIRRGFFFDILVPIG